MEIKRLELINNDLYHETLDNGLNIYLVKDKRFDDYYISYFTNYGGMDLDFYHKDKIVHTTPGLAHFLEHKLFDKETEETVFDFFSKSGSKVNAFTSYTMTAYILLGEKNFFPNLNKVLSYVNNFSISPEKVEKEKGIITEELRMYEDYPDWKIDHEITKMVFQKSNLRHDVGGSVEDIQKISKEELEFVYDVFYHPKNMAIVITGNIDLEKTIETIRNHESFKKYELRNLVKKVVSDEKIDVVEKEKEIFIKGLSSPRMNYVFKVEKGEYDYKRYSIMSIFLKIVFGPTSEFFEKGENNYFKTFSSNVLHGDSYYLLDFNSLTDDAEKLVDLIKEEIKTKKLEEKDLELMKKACLLEELGACSNNESLARTLSFMINRNSLNLDPKKIIDEISLEDLENFRKDLDLENTSLLKVNYQNKTTKS